MTSSLSNNNANFLNHNLIQENTPMTSQNSAIIIDQFTKQAAPFANVLAHSNEEAMQLLLSMSGVTNHSLVLDVACGPGIVACAFAETAKNVTGIDITPAMIEQAVKLQNEKKLKNLAWKTGDVENLPFPDNYFDIVVSRYAFHHFSLPKKVFSEMIRVCKKGGIILNADVAPSAEKIEKYDYAEKLRDCSHTSALAKETYISLATDNNLINVVMAPYKLEISFDLLLKAAFHEPEKAKELVALIKSDVGKDEIGLGVHKKGEEIFYAFPVVILKAQKG